MALLSHILAMPLFGVLPSRELPVIWRQVGLQDVQAGTPARMAALLAEMVRHLEPLMQYRCATALYQRHYIWDEPCSTGKFGGKYLGRSRRSRFRDLFYIFLKVISVSTERRYFGFDPLFLRLYFFCRREPRVRHTFKSCHRFKSTS